MDSGGPKEACVSAIADVHKCVGYVLTLCVTQYDKFYVRECINQTKNLEFTIDIFTKW